MSIIMSEQRDFVDTYPSRPIPLQAAHAASETDDDREQPDGAGIVWAALLGVGIALGGTLLVWAWRALA